jgi:hypothetical protein
MDLTFVSKKLSFRLPTFLRRHDPDQVQRVKKQRVFFSAHFLGTPSSYTNILSYHNSMLIDCKEVN